MFTNLIFTLTLLADPTRESDPAPSDLVIVKDEIEGHLGECGIVEEGAGCLSIWWDDGVLCSCFFRDPVPSPCPLSEGDCSACTDDACWDLESMVGTELDYGGTEVCSLDGARCSYVPERFDVEAPLPLMVTPDDLPEPRELGGYMEVCILFLHVETLEIRRSSMMVKLAGITCASSGSGCEASSEPTSVWIDGNSIVVEYDDESFLLRTE